MSRTLMRILTEEGFIVFCASTGAQALTSAQANRPDVILLDYQLPDTDGLEVCRKLKQARATNGIPIIMVTGRSGEAETVAALEVGADDYIVKPFSAKVLIARVRTTLRRLSRVTEEITKIPVQVHSIGIDEQRVRVTISGVEVKVTATEFRLLVMLASQPGRTFTRNQIVEGLNGGQNPVTGRSIDVHVVSLRKKLLGSGECIETMRGVGYRMRDVS